MELTIDRKSLTNCLKTMSGTFIGAAPSELKELSSAVLIRTSSDDRVEFQTLIFDKLVGKGKFVGFISSTIPADVKEIGESIINGVKLFEITQKLDADILSIGSTSKYKTKISAGNFSCELEHDFGFEVQTLGKKPFVEFSLKGKDFKTAFNQIAYACRNNQITPEPFDRVVNFNISSNSLEMQAAKASVIAVSKTNIFNPIMMNTSLTVWKSVSDIVKSAVADDTVINFGSGDNHCVQFSFGDTVIVCNQAEINFPDIENFKLKDTPTATVDTKEFLQALKMLKVFAKENDDNKIVLKFKENSAGLFAYSLEGCGEVYVDAIIDESIGIAEISVDFNKIYAIVGKIESSRFDLEIKGGLRGILKIRDSETGKFDGIISGTQAYVKENENFKTQPKTVEPPTIDVPANNFFQLGKTYLFSTEGETGFIESNFELINRTENGGNFFSAELQQNLSCVIEYDYDAQAEVATCRDWTATA